MVDRAHAGAPTVLDLRWRGKGRFDLSGMPVQDLALFASFADARLDFAVRTAAVGDLQADRAVRRDRAARLAERQSEARVRAGATHENTDRSDRETVRRRSARDLPVAPSSLQLRVPADLALWVEASPGILGAFAPASSNMSIAAPAARYTKPPRPHSPELRNDSRTSRSNGRSARLAALPPPGLHSSSAPPQVLAAPDGETEQRVAAVLDALDRHQPGDARARLRELERVAADDPRLPILQRWLQWFPPVPPSPVSGSPADAPRTAPPPQPPGGRLRAGLQLYLLGEYSNALREFAAARHDPMVAADAAAWMRRVESEMQRLSPAAAPAPQIVERIVTQTTAPVFALRNPSSGRSVVRAGTLRVTGQVSDDTGVDRIEASVNGQPLLEPDGSKLQLRPEPTAAPPRQMPFELRIPLQDGDNQIVVTAYEPISRPLDERAARRQPAAAAVADAAVLAAAALLASRRSRGS